MKRFELGVGAALFAAMAGSIILCGILVHLTWSRAADVVTRNLLGALESQIGDAARRAWWARVETIEALARTMSAGIGDASDPAAQQRLVAAGIEGSEAAAFAVFARADGTVLVVDGRSDGDRRIGAGPGRGALVPAAAAAAPWLAEARARPEPGWLLIGADAAVPRGAVGYVRSTPAGTLILALTFERFAEQLAAIPVGRTGLLHVVAPDGGTVISSRPEAGGALAAEIGRVVRGEGEATPSAQRLVAGGDVYAVTFSPLYFRGWRLAVAIPESDFLGDIERMRAWVALGLVAFVLVIGIGASVAARRLVARPLERVVGDIALIERFALDSVPLRRSPLREIDRLSSALVRMSNGLADFAKFIPTELVRRLLAEGIRAEPGGRRREITVLFADLAGFTRLSEEEGDAAVEIVGAFLDIASREIARTGGTVDKFIGDAVMAFWGAPLPDADHAANACTAAGGIIAAFDVLRASDPRFASLAVRVGVQTGPAIVGNVGSRERLNYTALGDTVNLASRLEGVNKLYGTSVLLGAETAERVAERFALREVDTVAVYGRRAELSIYELLPPGERPGWVERYEEALRAFRARRFDAALLLLDAVDRAKPCDGPARRLRAACLAAATGPLRPDWRPVTSLEMK